MKKMLLTAVAVLMMVGFTTDSYAKAGGDRDYGAAAMLSMMFPGAGEWYNSGFKGGFPVVECIVGFICPCVKIASVFDAADGSEGDRMRINFWSAP